MKKIIRGLEIIRHHWKKSIFFTSLVSFGVNYGRNMYNTRQMMRFYCEEAAKYGDDPQPLTKPLRQITVILNPAAKKKKCKHLFEKYCAPLLHLAGVLVTVVQTEYEGQAKDLPEVLSPMTDAIIIAGGDGTLSETVTGLLRRAEGNLKALNKLPIAILPLGRTNQLANVLYGNDDEVKALAEATMAVIDGSLRQLDVIKVEPIEEEGKPVYCLSRVEWGAHREVHAHRDKFWLFGRWREYVSYLFAGSPQPAEWTCQYSEPCRGCSKCYLPDTTAKRWWHSFIPKRESAAHLLVPNESCGVIQEKKVTTVRLSVVTDSVSGREIHNSSSTRAPQMSLQIAPTEQGAVDLASEGWKKLNGQEPTSAQILPARHLRLIPSQPEGWISIDSEDYELKPMALTLLPRTVTVFMPRADRQRSL